MSDGNATKRLRKLLDERGVEYKGFGSLDYILFTEWHVGDAICHFCESKKKPIELVHRMFDVTPEQAIAATLGSERAIHREVIPTEDGRSCRHEYTWRRSDGR